MMRKGGYPDPLPCPFCAVTEGGVVVLEEHLSTAHGLAPFEHPEFTNLVDAAGRGAVQFKGRLCEVLMARAGLA